MKIAQIIVNYAQIDFVVNVFFMFLVCLHFLALVKVASVLS